ncbi:hypothetical protein [Puerhibacterium puerhi]|uniref:hypothetical protein n=1 Tax=Puerhibacterium puerhi TaxID=2692623 RepID=UPI00135921A7|nr:hypothetical protein [Puerhibacterium puerhi]
MTFKAGDTVRWRGHGEYRPFGDVFVLLDKAPAVRRFLTHNAARCETPEGTEIGSHFERKCASWHWRNGSHRLGGGQGQAWWLQDAHTGAVSPDYVARESELEPMLTWQDTAAINQLFDDEREAA